MVIYLDDNSDYLNGLWGVVKAIIGDTWDGQQPITEVTDLEIQVRC